MTGTLRSADGRVIVPERLRRRRVEVRRDQGRRRLRWVVIVVCLGALAVVSWGLMRSPLLAVNEVVITGSTHVDRSQVVAATGIHDGVAMMDVSSRRAQKRLEALPWVADATVTRQWPHRVTVKIEDRRPVAQVGTGASVALISSDGRVLASGVKPTGSLPTLMGVTAGAPGTRVAGSSRLLAVARALPNDLVRDVRGVGHGPDGSSVLTVRSGGRIRLGAPQNLPAKFAAITTMLDHLGTVKTGCTLDVAVPSAPMVTPGYRCA